MNLYTVIMHNNSTTYVFRVFRSSSGCYSISTLNSDKISKIWNEMRIKFGCNEDKIWI